MPGPTDTHDGSPQRRLSLPLHSLRFRLAGGISLAVLLVGTGAGVLSWRATLDEVHDFQDEVLEQAARLVQPRSGTPLINLPAQGCALTDDDEEGLIVQRLPSAPIHRLATRRTHMNTRRTVTGNPTMTMTMTMMMMVKVWMCTTLP